MNETDSTYSTPLNASSPIGIFDSGLGGLRVLDRLINDLPNERFVYLGDTAHMPYGEKAQADVLDYATTCLHWMMETHHVKMLIIACNTASAVMDAALLKPYVSFPVVDPIRPICNWLLTERSYERVGVMATRATVQSNRYGLLLNQDEQDMQDGAKSAIRLTQVGCGQLASMIEAGLGDTPACYNLLRDYIQPLLDANVQAIILGSTHYPYVMKQVAELAPGVDILDPAVFMALEVRRLLAYFGLAQASSERHTSEKVLKNDSRMPQDVGNHHASVDYFVTAGPDRFFETSLRMPFQAMAMQKPRLVELFDQLFDPLLSPYP